MKTGRKPFMPLDPEIDDAKPESLAVAKGVGKFEKPILEKREGEGAGTVHTPALTPEPEVQSNATPRSRMKKVHCELPDYVWTELKIRAVQQQATVRHVLMQALREHGFSIREEDMFDDGRRQRGNSNAAVQ
jgi:hypothetical protein